MERTEILSRLEENLGYRFRDRILLERALTHSSFAHEQFQAASRSNPEPCDLGHYERMEFLGDAILDLAVSDLLMRKYLEAPEGDLSKLRSGLVNCDRLTELARELGLGPALNLGRGEESSGGRDKPSILAAVFEAVIAAVYLDGGFDSAFQVVARHFQPLIDSLPPLDQLGDYKTPLQEKVQARFKTTPYYRVIQEEGPDHSKTFKVEITINGRAYGRGRGRSKKEAEQDAARQIFLSGVLDE